MSRSIRGLALTLVLLGFARDALAQDIALLRRPRNAAIAPPMGQGLDLVQSAEPLGKGRFRLRALNRSNPIVIPALGEGSLYTGRYGVGYGLRDNLDLNFIVPFMLDSVNGLNKYGSGDPVVGIKLSRPGKLPANFYTGYQLLLGLPLGYKGEHGLDTVGGLRSFSSGSFDLGLQLLMDIHFQHISLYLNGGMFRSGNLELMTQLLYGFGLEVGRASRWVSFNLEYQSQVTAARQARAEAALKFGTRLRIFKGIELELNRELGLLEHPLGSSFTFGLRLHGFLNGKRQLASRSDIYEPVPAPKRLYRPVKELRLAIVDFGGYEQHNAGQRIVDKILTRLEPHDSLVVVDLKHYADVPKKGFLKPRQALELATKLGVDIVVTGAVSKYEVDRFAGINLPYVIKLPEAQVEVGLRFRVLELDATKTQMQAHNHEVVGTGRMRKGVQLLSGVRRDITASASAIEMRGIQEDALNDLVGNMLAAMADHFTWVPPDFLP